MNLARNKHSKLGHALQNLAELVAFETVSRCSNLELIKWAQKICDQNGARTRLYFDDTGQLANLVAVFGPLCDGGIILSGHSDVVPIDDQDWDSNPFQTIEKDGKIFGRGTCDMKGFSACVLALAEQMGRANLKKPVYFCLSYDEEIGCWGAHNMVAQMVNDYPKIDLAIIGEPSMMKPVSAQKGISTFIVEITGHEAHSSRPDKGVSAIMASIPIINLINELGSHYHIGNTIFEPPGPTLTIGIINGGTAGNILAHHCRFNFDIRYENDAQCAAIINQINDLVAKIDGQIKEKFPECGAKITQRSYTPPLLNTPNSSAEEFVRALTGENNTIAVSYGSEAGIFQKHGIDSVIMGPGSILQAHQPNEFIEIDQMNECLWFLEKIIEKISD